MNDNDNTQTELSRLRDIMEINHAIRALDSHKKTTTKRYTHGIRLLEKELATAENELMSGDAVIEGTSCMETRSERIRALISDPCAKNIPSDANP